MQKPIDALKSGGKKDGLEIWVLKTVKPSRRSSNLFSSSQPKPEPEHEVFSISPAKQGIFYEQDIYIVLKTTGESKTVHFWIGEAYTDTPPPWLDTFEDLDLGWKACQHFEFQGYECELFESYFDRIQPAIRYKRGKHPEPFAERERGETRFYKLDHMDKPRYRVKEIPFNIDVMTKQSCFILDTDYNTRSYMSVQTEMVVRKKSVIVCHRIRDQDHEGTGDVEVVDLNHSSSSEDREQLVKSATAVEDLEVSYPEVITDEPDDDPASPIVKMNMVTLIGIDDVDTCYPPRFRYVPRPKKTQKKEEKKGFFGRAKRNIRRVLGLEGKPEIEYEIPALEDKFIKQLMPKPFKCDNLTTRKCYILSGKPGKSVFVWVGKASNRTSNKELFECMRLELRRCAQYEIYDNQMAVTDSDAYTKKTDKPIDQNAPEWTHIIKEYEGYETVKFKKYFQNWA